MTDAGANAPPITYEVDGIQYISILSAGNALAGSKHGDKIYTFALNGKLLTNTTDDVSQDKEDEEEDSDDTASADTEAGLTLYENTCLACHGNQGAGGHNGPDLQISLITSDKKAVIEKIKAGGATMPAFEESLTDDEMEEIAKYVTTVISPLGK
ncbi:MAG: c-type cytochrome [Paenisporosarcina sp.]